MDPFVTVITRIIKEQQAIIGPVALDQAKKVHGLQLSTSDDVKIIGVGRDVLKELVMSYAKLFGQASIEVCKEAVAPVIDKISSSDVPDVLKN